MSVLLWVATGGAGFVLGLVGIAATKRNLQEPVRASSPERPAGVR